MKKILAFLIGCTAAVSSLAYTAFAEAEDITLTYGTAASGDGWSYDGETLTLDGGEYGYITFDYGKNNSDLKWTIIVDGDSAVSGIGESFYSYSYPLDMRIVSESGCTLDVSSWLSGGGCDHSVLTVDGVCLNAEHISLGGSGSANSGLVLTNGANVVVSEGLSIQDLSLSGNSQLEVKGGLEFVSVIDGNLCSWGNISLEEGSEIRASSMVSYFPAAYSWLYSDYYSANFDLSALPVNSPLYWELYENYFAVLDNGIPATSVTFRKNSNKKIITDPSKDNTANIGMTGTFDGAQEEQIVYSVDVSWGSMEFTYTGETEGTWDPKTHTYVEKKAAGWSCAEGADKVTVTNHSNADVDVSFSYVPNEVYNIGGSFDKTETTTLARGVVNDPDNADSVTASLTLDENTPLGSSVTSETVIGTVTVKLSESR